MKSRHIRRLPVVKNRRLVGIVTFTDLMRAQPSPANSLAVWEIPALLLKTYVSEIMTKELVTISATATIEEAAVLMRQHKIGALPVVEQGALLGIITESDIFDAFVDLMGLRRGGARLTIGLDGLHRTDRLDEVLHTIQECGVQINSLAVYPCEGPREMVVRVNAPYPLHLVQTLTERGLHVTHLAPLSEPVGGGT
jgi:acetoin utilization protein AcuB